MAFYRCISTGSGKGSVEPFISSTGNQILTLPFYSDEGITLSFDLLQCDYPQSNSVILGDRFDYDGVVLYADGNVNHVRMTHASDLTYTPTKWIWSHIEMDFVNCTTKVDGVTVYSGSDTHQHYVQYLFGLSGRLSCCGIKNFKVYKNDILFLDFTPMRDAQTGEGYFHDEVSGNDYYADNPLVYCDELAGGDNFRTITPSGHKYATSGEPSYTLVDSAVWKTFTKQADSTHLFLVLQGSAWGSSKNVYLEIPIADLPIKTTSQDNYLTIYHEQGDLNIAMWEDNQTIYISWSGGGVPVSIYENVKDGGGSGGSSFEEVLHNGQVSTTADGGAYMTATYNDISSHKYTIVKLYSNVSGTDYIGYYVVNIADIISATEVFFSINLHTSIGLAMTTTAIRTTIYGGTWENIYADVAVSDTELF